MNINRFSLFIVPSLLCGHANVMHAQAEKIGTVGDAVSYIEEHAK